MNWSSHLTSYMCVRAMALRICCNRHKNHHTTLVYNSKPHQKTRIKSRYGDEDEINARAYKGRLAYDDWKKDSDAAMFISGHHIDSDWYHCVLHVEGEPPSHAIYAFEYNHPTGSVFMVADLLIEESARDIHITSAIVDYNARENNDIRLLEMLISKRIIHQWVVRNYLTAFFGPDWQITINKYRGFNPKSMLESNYLKAKRIGRSSLTQCKNMFSPEWGRVYIIQGL